MVDVAFPVTSEHDFEHLTKDELLAALLQRVARLVENWDSEAFGFCDEIEEI